MEYKRTLDLHDLLRKKSFFLLGPRATGKTFLIQKQLTNTAFVINLLNTSIFLRLSANPHALEEMILTTNASLIVIDEIQLVPSLLNEVHRLIEERRYTFLLTGSSARKLKQKNVNLLAGRAWQANLFPLTSQEIKDFSLEKYMQYGGLPAVYDSPYPEEELDAYVNTYLKEEIQAEALVRKIPAFARFLTISAITSGHILNFSNIANDIQIPLSTVRDYYQILEDTLVGFMVPSWKKSTKRKAVSAGKFYYFDLGVRNHLANIKTINHNSNDFGQAFEHFIALELRAYLSYKRIKEPLSYWRSTTGSEVDFIIGDKIAIEVKSSSSITPKHMKGLRHLKEENAIDRYILVSQDHVSRHTENIDVMHWKEFLTQLWNNQLLPPMSPNI